MASDPPGRSFGAPLSDFVAVMTTAMIRFYGHDAAMRAAEIAQGLRQAGSIEPAEDWIAVCFAISDRQMKDSGRIDCSLC